MWSRTFWKRLGEQMLMQGAAATLAILGTEQLNILRVDWINYFGLLGGQLLIAFCYGLLAAKSKGTESPTMSK